MHTYPLTSASSVVEAPHSEPRCRPQHRIEYLPTLDQIAADCSQIQAQWTPDERHWRQRGNLKKAFQARAKDQSASMEGGAV